ncbi:unnamed protein product [Cuscuta epithymum]|uniref:Uncharacterized protein n=1 Tax=Cuscuta epithymum TaxID=186058 RepID=A0AAV0EYX7_9ASTE|nr:unnamed protein product [Cuscuta epithymum]
MIQFPFWRLPKSMFTQTFLRRRNGGCRGKPPSFFISFRSTYSTTAVESPSFSTTLLSDYLSESLGFSREESTSIAARVTRYSSPTKPILVVDFLKQMGLDLTQIKACVSKYPKLLYFDVDKNLNPKLQCLQDLGFSGSGIADIVFKGGGFLDRGLDTNLKPNIALLKEVFGNNEDVSSVIKNYPALLRTSSQVLYDNVSYFQKLGFSNQRIKWFMARRPMAFRFPLEWFKERAHMLENDFGICPNSTMFFYGMYAMTSASKSSMEKKFAVFRSFGWSDSEIVTMFQKQPFYFTLSEDNLRKKLDYFMNGLGCKMDFLSTRSVFTYSLEKRVMPRVAVLDILREKKLFVKTVCVYTLLCLTESKFEKQFLLPYKDLVPDLCESYMTRTIQ